ncbi:MAG: cytochrome c5 family protein [Gammaproteobacteria bacterium]|nr:MAG: cytochrome c5 family protein [Gammaproteobacteria bacterium]
MSASIRRSMLAGLPLLAALIWAPAAPAGGDPEAGKTVYQQHCRLCHDRGMMGAPKLGDAEAWKPRLARGEQALLQSVLHGRRAMPPRGGCRSCSDQDLENALAYILSRAR